MTADYRIVSAGDSTVVVEFEARVDAFINARAITLANAIEGARYGGVRDVVTTYRTVAVYFDPLRTDLDHLLVELERLAPFIPERVESGRSPIEVPVCYGGEHGPDLEDVARFGSCSADEVVRLHASRVYRVYMVGFVPGFAYMGTVDPRIGAPRRPTPRVRVPARSVGVAGLQTGIYPTETPGGWRLIGRTPRKPFDPDREDPFLFKPGDTARFVPIMQVEYDALVGQG